jgi:hypothetical protein
MKATQEDDLSVQIIHLRAGRRASKTLPGRASGAFMPSKKTTSSLFRAVNDGS